MNPCPISYSQLEFSIFLEYCLQMFLSKYQENLCLIFDSRGTRRFKVHDRQTCGGERGKQELSLSDIKAFHRLGMKPVMLWDSVFTVSIREEARSCRDDSQPSQSFPPHRRVRIIRRCLLYGTWWWAVNLSLCVQSFLWANSHKFIHK